MGNIDEAWLEQWLRNHEGMEIVIRGHGRGVRTVVQDDDGEPLIGGFATSIGEAMKGMAEALTTVA